MALIRLDAISDKAALIPLVAVKVVLAEIVRSQITHFNPAPPAGNSSVAATEPSTPDAVYAFVKDCMVPDARTVLTARPVDW